MLYAPIPYASEQGIFAAFQGIKSGAQGNSRPDQGISRWSAIWRFAVVTTRSFRQISNVAEKANKDAARSSKALSIWKAYSTHAAEHVDANDRRSGRYTELTRDGGRGFASPFLHRRKADPTARPYPLPGTLTFFDTVFMALRLLESILFK